MALVDEARAELVTKGPSCTAGIYFAALSADQRAEVDEAFNDQGVTTTAIVSALEARAAAGTWPDPPKAQAFRRHLRGLCCCG